jgi:hypothetical protein
LSVKTFFPIQKVHAYIEGETCTQIIKSSIFQIKLQALIGLSTFTKKGEIVSAIKPYEGFGDVDHTIKELMSL